MTVSIRYGILGPIESSSWFVKAVASSPNSEIVALACEKTKEKQNLINVPVFESYSELCQSPDVDVILFRHQTQITMKEQNLRLKTKSTF